MFFSADYILLSGLFTLIICQLGSCSLILAVPLTIHVKNEIAIMSCFVLAEFSSSCQSILFFETRLRAAVWLICPQRIQ